MRRRIDVVIIGDLFRCRAVWLHAPDLAAAGTRGIEVDELAVRRVIGSIIECVAGQPDFGTAAGRHREQVGLAGAAARKGNGLAVGRPGVEITRCCALRQPARRCPAGSRQQVDLVEAILALGAAHRQRAAVRRDTEISAASDQRAGGDRQRCTAGLRRQIGDALDPAILEDVDTFAARCPVGRLHVAGNSADHHRAAKLILGLDSLQRAVKHRFRRSGDGRQSLQRHMGKHHLVGRVHVVRDSAEADVERLLQMQGDRSAHLMQRLALHRQQQRKAVAALLQAHCPGCIDVELDVL